MVCFCVKESVAPPYHPDTPILEVNFSANSKRLQHTNNSISNVRGENPDRTDHKQGGDTPIRAVVRAATGLISESWPRILRKGCSRYAFFRILSAVKRSTAEIQRSQTVKSLFAMRSSGQAAKMTVKISWPRSQLWLRREWECHPLDKYQFAELLLLHRKDFGPWSSHCHVY